MNLENKKEEKKTNLNLNLITESKRKLYEIWRFIVRFALMKLIGLQNVYSNTDKNIYNYSITCLSFTIISIIIIQLQITIYIYINVWKSSQRMNLWDVGSETNVMKLVGQAKYRSIWL